MTLIALEEHYAWDPGSVGNVVGACTARSHPVRASRISSTLPIPPSNGFRRLRTCVPQGVTATSSGELEPICSLRAKRTRSNGTTAPPTATGRRSCSGWLRRRRNSRTTAWVIAAKERPTARNTAPRAGEGTPATSATAPKPPT